MGKKFYQRLLSGILGLSVLCTGLTVAVSANQAEDYDHLLLMAEAEDARMFGNAKRYDAAEASKGAIAGDIGPNAGTVEHYVVFDVSAPETETYKLVFAGINAEGERRLYVSVNGGEPEILELNSGSWSKPADAAPLLVELQKGKNEIKCYNPNGRVPNLDVLKIYTQGDFQPEEGAVYLSDLKWERAESGWADHPVQKDKPIQGNVLVLACDTPIAKGIGTHAQSEIVYKLGGAYERFRSAVGVAYNRYGSSASVRFQVIGDGTELYDSGEMKGAPYTSPQFIDVDITGVDELKLVVDSCGSNADDWANFGYARLLPPSTQPGGAGGPGEGNCRGRGPEGGRLHP